MTNTRDWPLKLLTGRLQSPSFLKLSKDRGLLGERLFAVFGLQIWSLESQPILSIA
jgi:hypothetical protein